MTTNIAKTVALALFALVSLGLVGCGGAASQVRRGAWSGELALHGSLTDAHYAAEDVMMAHCAGRARIVSSAEAERVAIADAVSPREIGVEQSGRRVYYVCVDRAPLAFRGRETDATRATASVGTGTSGL